MRLLSALHLVAAIAFVGSSTGAHSAPVIICPEDASPQVKLAAKEVRRYLYLRTGELLPIAPKGAGERIVFTEDKTLGDQGYSLACDGRNLVISGGSPQAELYGAYAFVEKLGVRFEISGDVLPDGQITFVLPTCDEAHQPLFTLRGIQPFHDFMEGPDWWNTDDYKAYASQMVKMKMNFIGFHSYPWFKPWTHVCPEPGVWIGLPEEVDANGRVKAAYPASWANTARPGPNAVQSWGHLPGKTGDFSAGGAQIFDRDDFGAEVMRGLTPWPKTPEDCNELFNRVGDSFQDAFGFARKQGIKVCIGIETPFWIPDELRAKLKAQGRNPDDPAVLREVCKGMFTRIRKSHPVDYFWLWTPERGLDSAKTRSDLELIHSVAGEMGLKTAVCGWGWLAHNFANYDKALPKDIAFSCINDKVGFAPVTGEFGKINGRDKWCIPWMEDDTDMTAPQLFAGRVRKDAADARTMGCTGLMGIHWRTRVAAPSLDMLALSGWRMHGSVGALRDTLGSEGRVAPRIHAERSLPVDDFYADWCRDQFGPAVAQPAAALFARMDGKLPRPACWAFNGIYDRSCGPGIIGDNDRRPWEIASKDYAFVDTLAALRPQVTGAANLERFDYWLGQFQYLKAMGKLRCTRGRFDQAVDLAEKDKTPASLETALSARRNLVADWTCMMTRLLETVSTPGEMGTVANLELHTRLSGEYLIHNDTRLEKLLGRALPQDQAIPSAYAGKARLIVPTVRTVVERNESLSLKILTLSAGPINAVTVRIRSLGKKDWRFLLAMHAARGAWHVALPKAEEDYEWCVEAQTDAGETLRWPATAPQTGQTVVVN